MEKLNGFVFYRGASMIDGQPIVAIATGLDKARKNNRRKVNKKTGAMVQTYILRDGKRPGDALRSGADVSICGDCKHRPFLGGACYVDVSKGPTVVSKALARGLYPAIDPVDAGKQVAGLPVRVGTYGDPFAVPADCWHKLLALATNQTGYTHQWRRPDAAWLKIYCMASTDTAAETETALAAGWRVFGVVPKTEVTPRKVTVGGATLTLCPASEEAGKKLTCSDCLACNGNRTGRKGSIFIPVHGLAFKVNRFAQYAH